MDWDEGIALMLIVDPFFPGQEQIRVSDVDIKDDPARGNGPQLHRFQCSL
jgi:hypothetical protein